MVNRKYKFPSVCKFDLIFNGRRYKAFKVSKANPFNDYEFDADFVVWDGLYDAAVSCGQISSTGLFSGYLAFSHVEIDIGPCNSLTDFVAETKKAQLNVFRDSGS